MTSKRSSSRFGGSDGAPEEVAPDIDPGPVPNVGAPDEQSDIVAKLAGAMHSVLELERVGIANDSEERRRSRLSSLREQDAAQVELLRTGAAAERNAIDGWVKAETERIQREAQQRQEAVEADLEKALATHRSQFDRAIDAVEVAIRTYREQVDDYFSRLAGLRDPVAIAELAVKRPVLALEDDPEAPALAVMTHSPSSDGSADEVDTTSSGTADVSAPDVGAVEGGSAGVTTELWPAAPSGSDAAAPAAADHSASVQDAGGSRRTEASPGAGNGSGSILRSLRVVRPMSGLSQRATDADEVEPVAARGGSCPDCLPSHERGASFCRSCGRDLAAVAQAAQ